MEYDKTKLNLPVFKRKFQIDEEYRQKMGKDSEPITKENLMKIMSMHTEKLANYIIDYERLSKEYKAAKRHYDVCYSLVYDFLLYDPSIEVVLYDKRVDRNDDKLDRAVCTDKDIQECQRILDDLECEVGLLEEYMKAFQQRSWTCKNILDLMKFTNGDFSS